MNTLVVIVLTLVAGDWDNVREVTRDTNYYVELRDGRCLKGRIVSSNEQQVVLDSGTAKRAEVLLVRDVGPYIRSSVPVYSGRSSWADVKASGAGNLVIVMKNGEQRRWQWPKVLEDRISLREMILSKVNIASVSYIRFNPLTNREEYIHHEDVDILAPRLWFRGLFLGKISVRLYDSTMAEDNSPVSCN